jgi:hypothetical protein
MFSRKRLHKRGFDRSYHSLKSLVCWYILISRGCLFHIMCQCPAFPCFFSCAFVNEGQCELCSKAPFFLCLFLILFIYFVILLFNYSLESKHVRKIRTTLQSHSKHVHNDIFLPWLQYFTPPV